MSCSLIQFTPPGWLPDDLYPDPGEAGSVESAGQTGFLEDETTNSDLTGQDAGSTAGSGALKPVGFVNYGEFDATVRAYSFIPLGSTEPAPAPGADTVSSANDGIGTWPNSSRFLSVPMGTYSWCIEWEEGDLD